MIDLKDFFFKLFNLYLWKIIYWWWPIHPQNYVRDIKSIKLNLQKIIGSKLSVFVFPVFHNCSHKHTPPPTRKLILTTKVPKTPSQFRGQNYQCRYVAVYKLIPRSFWKLLLLTIMKIWPRHLLRKLMPPTTKQNRKRNLEPP